VWNCPNDVWWQSHIWKEDSGVAWQHLETFHWCHLGHVPAKLQETIVLSKQQSNNLAARSWVKTI